MKKAETLTKKMSLAMKAAIGGAIVGLFMLGKKAIGAAADMEMLTTQFEVMLGSTEKANAMMEKLKTFAASTPFQLNDLAKGSQQLLSFGVAEKDVINTMRMLGDTAGGNSEKLNGLVLAYGKVQTKGKASMEELNMMAERGLPILQILQKQTGLTEEAFFKAVSKGQISKENITQAFQTMTSSGGMFFEGMKKQSMTFHGLVSTMKDNFQLLLAEVGSALMPALKTLITVITKLVQGPLKIIAKVIASIIAPILEMLGKLFMEIFSAFIPLIQSIMEAVGPLIRLLLKILIPIIGEVIHIILKVLGPAIKALIWVLGKLTIAFTYMMKLVDELVNFIKERNKKANEEYARAFNWLRKNFSMLLSQIKEKFIWLKNKIIEIFQEIVKWLFPDYDQMIAVIKEKFSAFFNWINENFGWVFKKVGEWFDYLAEKFSWLTEKIRKALEFLGIGTAKKEEKEVKLKIKPPSISSTMQQGIKNSTANVNMTNNIGINAGGGIGSRRGAKKIMEQAARNVFTIELKKVLVNAGY